MIYSGYGYDFYENLEKFYSSRLDRLKEIQSLEFKERFDAVKEDFGFAPMLSNKTIFVT